jgi:ABC-2 type transport system ATP-binding protein
MTLAIRTSGLTKTYGETVALDGVDISVEEGSVYGLVGPNGAGKTTLIGILSSLRRATSGSVSIDVPSGRVAAMPDTPEFEPWLTAREVVELSRRLTAPQLPTSKVDEALAVTGIADSAQRRVGGFSRGMLQRLGLAATVVGEPDVLLLDEPCAALDPAGRRDVLDLVAKLGERSTVVFSSHILADVERVCDTVGVLARGKVIFEGPLHGLLGERLVPEYSVRVRAPANEAVAALRAATFVERVDEGAAGALRVRVTSLDEAELRLAGVLSDCGAKVIAMEPIVQDLESAFLQLTGEAPVRPDQEGS